MATINKAYGSYTALTITNLNNLAPSLTAGWQSARVSNLVTKALDYEVLIYLAAVNTAPANDKIIYIYAVPWVNDDSTGWYCPDAGNATMPTGSEGTITIANANTTPSNIKLLGVINNLVQNTPMSNVFNLSNAFGVTMPDGWSLILINYTGATLASSGSIIAYRAITETVA